MRKNIFFSLLLSLFSSFIFLSTAQALEIPAPPSPIFGHWIAEEPISAPGVLYYLSFDFSVINAQLHVNCVFGAYASLNASASARADYQDSSIYIQEKNESVVNDGYRFCRATLMPARWEALFDSAGRMILFIPAPYQARLTLIRDESSVPLR